MRLAAAGCALLPLLALVAFATAHTFVGVVDHRQRCLNEALTPQQAFVLDRQKAERLPQAREAHSERGTNRAEKVRQG